MAQGRGFQSQTNQAGVISESIWFGDTVEFGNSFPAGLRTALFFTGVSLKMRLKYFPLPGSRQSGTPGSLCSARRVLSGEAVWTLHHVVSQFFLTLGSRTLHGPSGLWPHLLQLWLILLELISWQNLLVKHFGEWVYSLIRRRQQHFGADCWTNVRGWDNRHQCYSSQHIPALWPKQRTVFCCWHEEMIS